MPIYIEERTEEDIWGVWRCDESEAELIAALDQATEIDASLARYNSPARRIEFLAVRRLVYHLLGEPFTIEYTPEGRPLLIRHPRFAQISISHTRGYVAAALHVDRRVGIDIEYRSERIAKIRSKFMSPDEEAAIDKQQETLHLLLHWSAKESLFKAIDQQAIDFRRHLHIHPFTPAEAGVFRATESRTERTATPPIDVYYRCTPDFVVTRLTYE